MEFGLHNKKQQLILKTSEIAHFNGPSRDKLPAEINQNFPWNSNPTVSTSTNTISHRPVTNKRSTKESTQKVNRLWKRKTLVPTCTTHLFYHR